MLLISLKDEKDLLQKVAKDDEIAFKRLFSAYHQELGVFVNSLLNDKETTVEVVQDIYLKIWQNRKDMPEVVNFTSYLFITARNHTLNKIRQIVMEKKRFELYKETIDSNSEFFNVVEDEKEKLYDLIENAIEKLPLQQQKVFVMRQQGLKNPEIARKLNISTNSVTKYQQLALRFVIEHVKICAILSPIIYILFKL